MEHEIHVLKNVLSDVFAIVHLHVQALKVLFQQRLDKGLVLLKRESGCKYRSISYFFFRFRNIGRLGHASHQWSISKISGVTVFLFQSAARCGACVAVRKAVPQRTNGNVDASQKERRSRRKKGERRRAREKK